MKGGTTLQENTPGQARDAYHIQIHSALDDLRKAVDSICFLKERIEEGDKITTAAEKSEMPVPSLSFILHSTANQIEGEAKRIRSALGEIKELIF